MYALPWKHTHQQPISKSFPMEPHPRVVFISSRVPAAEVGLSSCNGIQFRCCMMPDRLIAKINAVYRAIVALCIKHVVFCFVDHEVL